MVSLRKEPQTQTMPEITPVHLMDEEETVRTYCPPKDAPANDLDIEIVVKQADKALLPAKSANKEQEKELKEKTFGGLDKSDWIEILIKSLFISALFAAVIFILSGFIGGGIELLREINFG